MSTAGAPMPGRGAVLPVGSLRTVVRFLLTHDPDGGLLALMLAALTGLVFAVVILVAGALVREVSPDPISHAHAVIFLALVGLAAGIQGLSLALGMRSAERCVRAVLEAVALRLRDSTLEAVETVGSATVRDAIARNVSPVSGGVLLVFQIVQHGMTLAVCGLAILVIAPAVFACLAVAGVIWVTLIRRRRAIEQEAAAEAGRAEDRFSRDLGEMIGGFRELHLDPAKLRDIVNGALAPAARDTRDGAVAAAEARSRIMDVQAFVWLLALVLLVFVLPEFGLAGQVTVAFVVLAVMWQWISELILVMPNLERAGGALQRLESVMTALTPEPAVDRPSPEVPPTFERLRLREVTYRYAEAEGESGFGIGPIDLTIRRGEIVFLTGHNGSGKSTLIKVLTGLYRPATGDMTVDDHPVTLAAWRALFAYVPTDYHLFRRLYGLDPDALADGQWLLDRLGMSRLVAIEDGAFSTRELSSGQRKRLGLAVAIMERRPVLVLDEWAADQDPAYRRVFYTDILPALRARGLTAIVVSHDDRYFHLADRQVRLADGRIAPDHAED